MSTCEVKKWDTFFTFFIYMIFLWKLNGTPRVDNIYKPIILQNLLMLILKHKHQANNLVKVSNTNTRKKLSTKTTIKTLQIGLNLLLKSRTNVPSRSKWKQWWQNMYGKNGTKTSENGTEAITVNQNGEKKGR